MAFISNASGFTLGEGTFNNIHGNLVIYNGAAGRIRDAPDVTRGLRREEEQDGLKIIRNKNLNLAFEIGSGPGYLLHAGEVKGRAVIVKVFNAEANAREHLEATVALSRGLLHPNVLRIAGVSSSTSLNHVIAYENAYWKTAEGPLAVALQEDLEKSIVLGFKLIAGLSAGINYLAVQGLAVPSKVESFDVFLDVNDRFLFCINPSMDTDASLQQDGTDAWKIFNALCQKVLRSANRVLHDEDIERIPVDSSLSRNPEARRTLVETQGPSPSRIDRPIVFPQFHEETSRPIPPRREYVWRTVELQQSLATIATQINRDLDLRRTAIRRFALIDAQPIHRCPGYVREEITLATRTVDSAVVFHDTPALQEVCPICHQVQGSTDGFRCICGLPNAGWRHTVKCKSCNFWSHRDCVGRPDNFICDFCALPNTGSASSGSSFGWSYHPDAFVSDKSFHWDSAISYIVDRVAEVAEAGLGRPWSGARSLILETFAGFVTNVLLRAEVKTPTLLVALAYVSRALPHLSIVHEEWALERVFLGALVCADKYINHNSSFKNVHWALCYVQVFLASAMWGGWKGSFLMSWIGSLG
ncbi:hypothetical protein FB45DRAFT_2162 [Roridomyces roridus]|uniref:Protein kinase domain-containing protein n=1 Tax=Roridomyces roridus TaxID=1738132 RepID=A0AAD7CIE2_9AGAR|nr:hypothetical protein FB45DRAFT_2162 [Roridomyces roridus]